MIICIYAVRLHPIITLIVINIFKTLTSVPSRKQVGGMAQGCREDGGSLAPLELLVIKIILCSIDSFDVDA